jgi:hypothetical protein
MTFSIYLIVAQLVGGTPESFIFKAPHFSTVSGLYSVLIKA